jgi:hypothetical protein
LTAVVVEKGVDVFKEIQSATILTDKQIQIPGQYDLAGTTGFDFIHNTVFRNSVKQSVIQQE